jgi:alkylation response protein AidB-like acyl-CoA dehydrogenase
MDFGFSEEQEKLRQEVHDFYVKELPEDFDGHVSHLSKEIQSFYRELQKKHGEKGYQAPGWPKEIGGLGLGELEIGVVQEQEGYWLITWPDLIGIHICGPGIFLFGTEEQKNRYLPEIANGQKVWYELFTEPNAGTDEANQETRAEKDGDDYIINGQKIYITGQYKPDWFYCLARTADTIPKHRGITLFVFPIDTPGVTINPLPVMGGMLTNEIFLDNVRVSKENIVGQENRGFYHAMETLEFERSNTTGPAARRRELQEFVQFCKEEKRNGKPLIKDPQVRAKLAKMALDLEVFRLAAWRTAWRFGERERLGPLDWDLSGLFSRMTGESHYVWMMNILGPYAQLKMGSKWAKLAGWVERRWQVTRSMHYAGTTEAIKIVLAGRVLGLPRIPAKFNPAIAQALKGKEVQIVVSEKKGS